MKIATLSQTKNHLSALIDKVRHGETILIAAAHAASENRPSTLDFACLDDRLVMAAQREGFNVTAV